MARRLLLSRRDFVQDDGVELSGGFWHATAPISNILDPRPQFVAEAVTNIDSAASMFNVDLGQVRNRVGVFWFAGLRTTSMGLIRLRASNSSDMSSPVYELNTTTWPQDSVAGDFTPWGDWTLNGVYSIDEYKAMGFTRFFVPTTPVVCRYIRVEIFDPTASSPVQVGCFGASEVWESPIDFAPAPQITLIDESQVTRVSLGSSYVTQMGMRRRFNFGLPAIDKSELLAKSLGLVLLKGKSKPLVAVSFPDEDESLEKTSVYGLVSQDNVISNPFFGHYSHPIQIDQLI